MMWAGDGVIVRARRLIGATKPLEAQTETIQGDLAVNIVRNVIHDSVAAEMATFEIGLGLEPSELRHWTPADQTWQGED